MQKHTQNTLSQKGHNQSVVLNMKQRSTRWALTDGGTVLRPVEGADDDEAETLALLAMDLHIGGRGQVDWAAVSSWRTVLAQPRHTCRRDAVLWTHITCRCQDTTISPHKALSSPAYWRLGLPPCTLKKAGM